MLLEIDRERSASAKLVKELEVAKRTSAEQAHQHVVRMGALKNDRLQIRQKLSAAEAALAENRRANTQLRDHLDKALLLPISKGSVKKPRGAASPLKG